MSKQFILSLGSMEAQGTEAAQLSWYKFAVTFTLGAALLLICHPERSEGPAVVTAATHLLPFVSEGECDYDKCASVKKAD
jgi:hypothetical protein